jgi:hypothetical protein
MRMEEGFWLVGVKWQTQQQHFRSKDSSTSIIVAEYIEENESIWSEISIPLPRSQLLSLMRTLFTSCTRRVCGSCSVSGNIFTTQRTFRDQRLLAPSVRHGGSRNECFLYL